MSEVHEEGWVLYGETNPHWHAVAQCFEAGQAANAVSWIERDLGEINEEWGHGMLHEETLEYHDDAELGKHFRVRERKYVTEPAADTDPDPEVDISLGNPIVYVTIIAALRKWMQPHRSRSDFERLKDQFKEGRFLNDEELETLIRKLLDKQFAKPPNEQIRNKICELREFVVDLERTCEDASNNNGTRRIDDLSG